MKIPKTGRIVAVASVLAVAVGGTVFVTSQDDDGGGGTRPVAEAAAEPGADSGPPAPPKSDAVPLEAKNERAEGRPGTVVAAVPRRETKPFSMVGVTWSDPAAEINGTVEVRTRSKAQNRWSDWLTLEADAHDGVASGPEATAPGRRGATEPLWVGASNGVEVRVVAADGQVSPAPAGLRVDLIDPGSTGRQAGPVQPRAASAPGGKPATTTRPKARPIFQETEPTVSPSAEASPEASPSASPSSAPTATTTSPAPDGSASPTASPTPTPTPTPTPLPDGPVVAPSTVTPPAIVTREGWGANESLNDEAPVYNTVVKAMFVHHTATAASYNCADSAAIVRSLHQFHVVGNGWKDLGYNFLVDKCGTLFEGRKGGIDKPVQGAHTSGFNTDSASVSFIGNYVSTAPSPQALAAAAHVISWKLGLGGFDPKSKVTLTAALNNGKFTAGQQVSFNRVSGHRDAFATECPGQLLYNQLNAIRDMATAVAAPVVGKVDGAGLAGTTWYTRGTITPTWSSTTPARLIKQYELLVDGKPVATLPGTATSARADLAPGNHTVVVRATHVGGRTTDSATLTVVTDVTAPAFTGAPDARLRNGTVNTTAAPVTITWKGTDNAAYQGTTIGTTSFGPAVGTWDTTARPGTQNRWDLTARDQAGNTAPGQLLRTPTILQESAAAKTGTWTRKTNTQYLGGASYSSSSKGASLSWTFTGRSVAWVVSRASASGQAEIWIDGKKVTTVDLKSSTTKYRDAIWTQNWATSGKHTIKIVVVGTAGRPAITTDGVVVLN